MPGFLYLSNLCYPRRNKIMNISPNVDTAHFKELLEKEKLMLEAELESVGRKNPENPQEWDATVADMDTLPADENEVADVLEERGENEAIIASLDEQYRAVKAALQKIEDGKYGICEVGNEPIEVERLEANPSAKTCIKHINENI
jgi:RNA polymerase-binding transcription factor DksA